MGSRRIPARRTLAVLAAVLTVPWPLALIPIGLADGEPRLVAFGALVAALPVGVAVTARWRRFRLLSAATGVVLLVLGTATAFVGGLLLWPGGVAFVLAALPGRDDEWPLGRVALVGAGLVVPAATAVAVVFVGMG
jgi:hypothetical protein